MENFGAGNWVLVVAYLAAVIVIGYLMGRGQRNTRDYFLGGRNIPWWGVSLSIIATETSALTFIGIPAAAYAGNLGFIQVVLGYVVARCILAAWFVPRYFAGEIYSPYQLLAERFGRGARQTAGGLFLVAGTLAAGVRVYVTCIPLKLLLGVEMMPAIVIFVGLSLIYTYLGGIKAVVWTDAVQFILLLAGGVFALFYIPTLVEGGWGGAMAQAGEAGKLEWARWLPEAGKPLGMPYNLWMGVLGGAVFGVATHGADQLIVQRVLTCRNVQDGRKAILLSAVIILPLFLVFLLVGTLLWAFYQQHPFAIPLPETRAGFKQGDYVFPIFILTEMPQALKGLIIVGILSAAMSSVSSALSALASVSTMDFFKTFTRHSEKDEAFFMRVSHQATVFWAAMLIVVAYLTRQATSVLNAAFSLYGLTTGAMLAAMLWALYGPKTKSAPVMAGMLASLGCMITIHLLWGDLVAWPWYTAIGCSIALGTGGAVHLFGYRSKAV